MADRRLGTTELRVAPIGLGCNNFGGRLDRAAAHQVVHAALDAGITLFDTADAYGEHGGSEIFLGEALGARRKDVVLITKFGLPMDDAGLWKGGSARYVMSAIEASLKRLKTDWIDLYYLHRPDPATPIEETLHALDKLIAQGKVRYIGCSNMPAAQVVEAERIAQANGLRRFVSCQDQYNLLSRQIEAELIPTMQAHGLTLIPYFPLASGMLTGKYKFGAPIPPGTRLSHKRYSDRFLNDENFRIVEDLRAFCAERGRSLLELAFGWLLSKPVVGCVIAGASNPEQIRQNVAAGHWRLSTAEMAEIDRLSTTRGRV
ncbi:MAG: aldo/keto reductase [Xanthobacteraceae bacterium]|jgi:aryl-alcohol dehydrogenase-like predicted oxidoreductase